MNGKIVSVDVFLDKLRKYIVDNDITKEELGRCLVDNNAFDAMFHDSIFSNFQSLVYVVHSKADRMLFRLERCGLENYYDREYKWLRLLKDISGLYLGDVDRAKYMKVNIRNAGRFLNKSDIAGLTAYPSTTREFLYMGKLWCLIWEICKISENFTI
jgi:hypothetical protein